MNEELAEYSIEMKIAGMAGGIGDRSLRFSLAVDPNDMDGADELWYVHLGAVLGPDDVENMKALAGRMVANRRR